jgi:integrase/recombinase XerD
MPKKGHKKPRLPPWDISDPQGMGIFATQFFEYLEVKGFSKVTVENRNYYLRAFSNWTRERGITGPREITRPILERYQRYLYQYRKRNGEPMSFRCQHSHLVAVRAFFKWLTRNNHILSNPASDIELPKLEKRLPRHILTISEVEQVLNGVSLTDAIGIRDRAILETFYSTGMRRKELLNLKLLDLDAERGTVMIRQGKGNKDRMIPIGERALAWIQKYLDEVRPKYIVEPDKGILFLTVEGDIFNCQRVTQIARKYVNASGIGKTGACHLFRHTMATLMLEGGADIRFIQQMLGHVKLQTTEIYTQVSIRKLKQVYEATHPGANLERKQRPEEEPEE